MGQFTRMVSRWVLSPFLFQTEILSSLSIRRSAYDIGAGDTVSTVKREVHTNDSGYSVKITNKYRGWSHENDWIYFG